MKSPFFLPVIAFALCVTSFSAHALGNPPPPHNSGQMVKWWDRQPERPGAVEDAKARFEAEKQAILRKVDAGEISKREAKELIEQKKQSILMTAKEEVRREKEEQKAQNRDRVKSLVREKLKDPLQKIADLPAAKKKARYNQILRMIDDKMASGKLSEKDKLLFSLIREILMESRDR